VLVVKPRRYCCKKSKHLMFEVPVEDPSAVEQSIQLVLVTCTFDFREQMDAKSAKKRSVP
ncbi:hypothetical protein, partial [Arthrobacter sp. ZBG10]|uniref:hypothetical protein n=1 Tax=Arthrobacter sp. ZBG10 TaxID=1676590 RepID=UPI001E2E0678